MLIWGRRCSSPLIVLYLNIVKHLIGDHEVKSENGECVQVEASSIGYVDYEKYKSKNSTKQNNSE